MSKAFTWPCYVYDANELDQMTPMQKRQLPELYGSQKFNHTANETRLHSATNSVQIKSKLLVSGAVTTTINDQECQHQTGRFESIRLLFNKSAIWSKFVQSHPSVKTVD